MSEELKNNSTKTFKPIIHQFLVALDKCFEMQSNERVWIEKFGDVTNSKGEQIEVKVYQTDLTDLDHNIWKTLKNWLDDSFDESFYKSLILLTTQTISNNSAFINWNSKTKEDKLAVLRIIQSEYQGRKKKSEDTIKLLTAVLDPSKQEKLLSILDKFIIQDNADTDEKLYKKLIETRTDGILGAKKEEYLNSLLGYILSPKITSNGWEIKNEDFRGKTKSLIETYASTTVVFPKIEVNKITDKTIKEYQPYLFIRKIENINYNEVKTAAIEDFIYSRRVLTEELKNYEISKIEYDLYEDEIFSSFNSKRRKALRNTDITNYINRSQDLYDDVTGENAPNFYYFNDTPKKYRNSLLHEIANDEDNPDKLVWKLEVKSE
ncbi:hypothetical protein [Phocoenobacter atlanticus]|uniref:hypothetical protein n=1 Tax=Phocoenobacter atlanticus TaxID=3416742 RepID=UPI00276DC755|nr:hypothetical protein [Pasteurella atlantica]MDP8101703.1 hypothetical protein [Pasteurella atlantica]